MVDNEYKALETFINEWRAKVKSDAYQEFADLILKRFEDDILHYPVAKVKILATLEQLKEKANENQKG
jgi:hypothetical protein